MIEVFMVIITSLITLGLACATAVYLFMKRYSFPYSNISPIWVIVSLISVSVSQLSAILNYIINNSLTCDTRIAEDIQNKPVIFFVLFNYFFVHNLIIIPLIVRSFSLGQSIKYNYHHLTRRFYDEHFQIESDNDFRSRYYSRHFYYIRIFSFPLIITFVLIVLFLAIPYTRCSLYNVGYSIYGMHVEDWDESCGGLMGDEAVTNHMVGDLLVNLYLTIEVTVFFTLLTLIFRYPINQDKFFLRIEFVSIFIIWVVCHNIFLGIFYFAKIEKSALNVFMAESSLHLAISLLYAMVTIFRKRCIVHKNIKEAIGDFTSFMNCHVTFKVFKDFIKTYHEEDYKLLSFWAEFFIFKDQVQKLKNKYEEMIFHKNSKYLIGEPILSNEERTILREYEEELMEMADGIFHDYYSSLMSQSSPNKFYGMIIDFPIDIYEKIEDISRRNYAIENMDLIFDESFFWVREKLYKLYLEFWENPIEAAKLERILFFIDFYEIRKIGSQDDMDCEIKQNMNQVI